MPRRKRVVIRAGDKQFYEVVSGGPKKFYNRRRVQNVFANKDIYGYEPLEIEWFKPVVEQLILARHQQHLSQTTLASKLGTTQSEISRFETGQLNPTVEFLDRIFKAMKLKISITIT